MTQEHRSPILSALIGLFSAIEDRCDSRAAKMGLFPSRVRKPCLRRCSEICLLCVVGGIAPQAVTMAAECPDNYRNVALNADDVQGEAKTFPHASSNSECRGLPCFAAKCAIDGKTANTGHGKRFPSWGPDKRKDLWWKVEFGRAVKVDKIVLYIRADFPHDRHWHSATIRFSDGSEREIEIEKTAKPQTFEFKARTVTWLLFTKLVQKEPLGWCGLSEVEVWGCDSASEVSPR